MLGPDRDRRKSGGSNERSRESKKKGTCTGSSIRITARTPGDLSGTFTKNALDALSAGGSGEIRIPKSTTAIEQDERGPGELKWSCPGGKSGTDTGMFNHSWRMDDSKLTTDGNEKLGYDGHTYGLCCMPGSEARKAAEKKGFDMDRCSWTFVERLRFKTRALSGSKTMHRCSWGFEFVATQRVSKGKTTKQASVTYWGVDRQIQV